jgi:hypothetical protein
MPRPDCFSSRIAIARACGPERSSSSAHGAARGTRRYSRRAVSASTSVTSSPGACRFVRSPRSYEALLRRPASAATTRRRHRPNGCERTYTTGERTVRQDPRLSLSDSRLRRFAQPAAEGLSCALGMLRAAARVRRTRTTTHGAFAFPSPSSTGAPLLSMCEPRGRGEERAGPPVVAQRNRGSASGLQPDRRNSGLSLDPPTCGVVLSAGERRMTS